MTPLVYRTLKVIKIAPSHLPPPGGGRDIVCSPNLATDRTVEVQGMGYVQGDGVPGLGGEAAVMAAQDTGDVK